jgi:hypothetical protein
MQVNLPIIGKSAILRDFIPHRVVLAYNEAMYKGVKIKQSAVSATKEELLQEFGPETIRSLDELPASEYDKKFAELREDYLRRHMEMEGMELGNVQEANLRKLEGMVLEIGGEPATRQTIEDLPTEDVETLIEAVEGIAAETRKKKASAPSAS